MGVSVKFVERSAFAAEWEKVSVQSPRHSAGLRSFACVLVGDRGAVADIERIQS
jgi:hypothetical protein